jgi:hypothetical protein
VIPPALLFLLSIALAIRGLLCSNWLYFFNFSVILLTHPSSSVALHKEIKIDTELDSSVPHGSLFLFFMFLFHILGLYLVLSSCSPAFYHLVGESHQRLFNFL